MLIILYAISKQQDINCIFNMNLILIHYICEQGTMKTIFPF